MTKTTDPAAMLDKAIAKQARAATAGSNDVLTAALVFKDYMWDKHSMRMGPEHFTASLESLETITTFAVAATLEKNNKPADAEAILSAPLELKRHCLQISLNSLIKHADKRVEERDRKRNNVKVVGEA